MNQLSTIEIVVQASHGTADDWPAWTDEGRWGIGPGPEDAGWAAEQNEDWDDDGPNPDDPIWDRWADEALANERIESGICY